jgi:hypothetical protein
VSGTLEAAAIDANVVAVGIGFDPSSVTVLPFTLTRPSVM